MRGVAVGDDDGGWWGWQAWWEGKETPVPDCDTAEEVEVEEEALNRALSEALEIDLDFVGKLKGCTAWRAASEIGGLAAEGAAVGRVDCGCSVAREGALLEEAQRHFDASVELLKEEFAWAMAASGAGVSGESE